MPTTLTALAAAQGAIALPVADLNAMIAGAAEASLRIGVEPPSLNLAAALEAAASAPGVSADASAMASLADELGIEVGALQAALALVLAIMLPFGTVGVHAYKLQGPIGSMGGDLGGQLSGGVPDGSGPAQEGTAVVLISADNGAIAALQALFAL